MELECDLSNINNEELLRKMWQQSEDSNRKKEIRSQLYKLRESRLRDLYQGDIMSNNTVAGFGKDPLTSSHGDALADQSFQSLKSKEIRDSMSPTEMKFQSMALNHPSTTGWNVQSSKEVSPDGRGFRAETIATTDGVENINGGTAEFKGRNEQFSSAHQQGDDKNFVKKAMESAKSHLQEKVVIGDENSGRTEVRTSSSTSTSSSQVFQSSSNVEYDERGVPIAQHPHQQPQQHQPYLMDPQRHQQQEQQYHQEQQRLQEEQRLYEQQFRQQHQQHLNQQQERRSSEQLSTSRQNTEKKATTQNVQTQETLEQNKRYVDMDKASPEYQQHVQHLMQQPGEIISQNVEYPKPNVKMITTVKRLPDGTIVRNKRYETEETAPTITPSTRQTTTTTSTNQTNQRRNQQPDLSPSRRPAAGRPSRPTEDVVDNVETTRYVQDSHNDDVETQFSTVKKSSRNYKTESTSETIHESSNPETSRTVTTDFSTHGFPSVKANKPTQEYPSDRPQGTRPNQGYPGPSDAVVPHHYDDNVQNITERRIPTKDGEVVIVSSEKKRNYKTSTNSERIVETEHNVRDDQHYQQLTDKPQDFSTHGFPSVREPSSAQPRQVQPQDFPLDRIPPGTRIVTTRSPNGEGVVVVSSQKSHTVKNSTNSERVIEHEVIRDDQGSTYPRIQPNTENSSYPYTVTTPGDQYPHGGEFPGSPRKVPTNDYSTHGFPSARSPTKPTSSPQGYPSSPRPNGTTSSPTKTQPRTTSPPNKFRTPTSTRETTERVIRKEKETDSAHRAFAASLRSSSPVETTRRDSYTTDGRHTPRSSVSSTKNFRRDMREGSHESGAPSEHSRISTTTVTRQTPPRSVGGKTTITRVVTTKTAPGSTDSSPRATKSPSPGKTVTTTTTTKTITSKTPTSPTKEVPKSTDNHQHTRKTASSTPTTTKKKPDTIFPINHEPLTITKARFSDNHSVNHKKHQNALNKSEKSAPTSIPTSPLTSPGIIEEPCLKKQFYLLGPCDQEQKQTTTPNLLTMTKKSEKSPLKQSSPQPAPNSRTSTPSSYKSSKPLMADDQDDQPEKLHATQPRTTTSPSRSRTPKQQLIGPNYTDTKPNSKDELQPAPRSRPVNNTDDERRTVNRETTFEKDEPSQPKEPKPSFEQPNVEWVVVDDVDIERDEDDDDQDHEDVDFGFNIKTKTKQLIANEKEVPIAPNRRPKQISSTIRTKQEIYTNQIRDMTRPQQGRPADKSPTKYGLSKPLTESRTPTQTRPQKLQPDNKTPTKSQPTKPADNKQQPKVSKFTPKSPTKDAVPTFTPTQRKPQTKVTTTDDHLVRRTSKTNEIVKERTTKVIDDKRIPDTPKRRIHSPENRPKQHLPVGRRPEQPDDYETVTIIETTHNRAPDKEMPHGRSPGPDNKPNQGSPVSGRPGQYVEQETTTVAKTTQKRFPEKETPKGRSPSPDKPNQRSPVPGHTGQYVVTVTKTTQNRFPDKEMPKGRSPSPDKPNQRSPIHGRPGQYVDHEITTVTETTQKQYPEKVKPHGRSPSPDKPNQRSPVPGRPGQFVEHQTSTVTETTQNRYPEKETPKGRSPSPDKPNQRSPVFGRPGKFVENETITVTETTQKRFPEQETPKGRSPIPDKPNQRSPVFERPGKFVENETTTVTETTQKRFPEKETPKRRSPSPENPNQRSPVFGRPGKFVENETITVTETTQKRFPEKETPKGRSRSPDNKPSQRSPVFGRPGRLNENETTTITETETTQNRFPEKEMPKGRSPSPDDKPNQRSPVFGRPGHETSTFIETTHKRFPERDLPKRRSESPENRPTQRNPGYCKEADDEEVITVIETTQQRFPERETPKRRSESPENRPKQKRPGYRTETNEEEDFVVIETSKKHVLTEQQTQELEDYINEPTYPDEDYPKPQKGSRSPNREVPQYPKNEEPSAPTPHQRKPKQNVPVDDQTFRKTLRTTEIVSTQMIEDEEFPEEDEPGKKIKPKERKPTETEEDDSYFESRKFVIKTSQNREVLEKQTQEFDEPKYPEDKTTKPQKGPKYPSEDGPQSLKKEVSPKYPEDKPQKGPRYPNKDGPQSPKKEVASIEKKPKLTDLIEHQKFRKTTEITTTTMDDEEFPEEDAPLKNGRPKSPQKEAPKSPKKDVSPLPTPSERKPKQTEPEKNDKTFRKTLRTTETTTTLYGKELPEDNTPHDKGPRPKKGPRDEKPTDEDETFTETSEFVLKTSQKRVVSEKQTQDSEEVYVTESNYPDNKKPQKVPRHPNKDIPKAPKRETSPTQKKPQQKVPEDDQTFRKTLRTNETLQEKTTKFLDTEKIAEEETPYRRGLKPEYIPRDCQPSSQTDEDETYTSEYLIKSSQKSVVSEKQIHELEENYPDNEGSKPQKGPKSPQKDVSPTRTQRKPQQKQPEENEKDVSPTRTQRKPKQKQPEDNEKDVSPTRTQRKPQKKLPEDDQTFRKTLRTSKTINESTVKTVDKEEFSEDESPERKPKYIEPIEYDDDETLTETSKLTINTSQKRVVSEKQVVVESEEEPFAPGKTPKTKKGPKKLPKPEEGSPYSSSSPLKPNKNLPVDDQTFRKSLRTTELPKPKDANESTTDDEELLIETCETHVVTQKITDKSPKDEPKPQDPRQKTPEQVKPHNKYFTTTFEETIETVKDKPNPKDSDKFPKSTKTPKSETFRTEAETLIQEVLKPKPQTPKPDEKWLPKTKPVVTTNINEQFIETEAIRTETPDGAFISKTTEPTEPLSPTFKKKGAGRRDTFEDRCRHILGMETYGDTPGSFKKQPITEVEEPKKEITEVNTTSNEDIKNTTIFQVKIEDCGDDDDDEPMSIKSVHKQIHVTEHKRNEPIIKEPVDVEEKPKKPLNTKETPKVEPKKKPSEPLEKPKRTRTQPLEPQEKSKKPETDFSDENETVETITETTIVTKTPRNLSPGPKGKPSKTSPRKSPETKPLDDTDDTSEQETYISTSNFEDTQEHVELIKKETKKSEMKITKKSTTSTSPRSVSPTKEKLSVSPRSGSPTKESLSPRSSPRSGSPVKGTPTKDSPSSPRSGSPTKESTPKRKPGREIGEPKSPKTPIKKPTPKPDNETKTTTTIKDRLRSSTRKTKSPSKQDQVDGSDSSSPEPSPTRVSERRRSSNISVITEIIIDHHTDGEPHHKKEKSPLPKRLKDSVIKDIIDSTVLPDKLPRKMLVTERKESAPVHRVTQKDKDSKMARSTSENLIKVKKPEPNSLSPKPTHKTTEHRRPNKCFATKSINLTTTDRLVNSQDMESVVIDIQHAKSSREPSPDKIVPTPVPAHFDTGKPRYPDVVQEPEDEHPRKKPQVKNIPIFEEEHNSYVGCHITEVNMERTTRKTTMDSLDYDQEILNNPLIEAPPSLDYPSLEKPNAEDDECLLTVHEKVSKFHQIAEEVKKPKPSSPFTREFDESCKVPEEDDCLLTVDEKVDKFLKTAENVTKPLTPLRDEKLRYFDEDDVDQEEVDDEDDAEFVRNERIYSSIKLAPSAPQKSPDLVRNISRHISRQSDVDSANNEPSYEEPSSTGPSSTKPFTKPSSTKPSSTKPYSTKPASTKPFSTPSSIQPSTTDKQIITVEVDNYDEAPTNEDFVECLTKNQKQKFSKEEFIMTHHQQETLNNEKYQQIPKKRNNDHHDHDDEEEDGDDDNNDQELIPHTATHTNIIEQRRQKDILTRPSVFDNKNNNTKNNKRPSAITTTTTTTTTTTKSTPSKSTPTKSPVKDSEKLRPDIKSRTKPATATSTNTNKRKPITTTSSSSPTSPQRKHSDNIEYQELRAMTGSGSNNVVETGVGIISKQTKVYNTTTHSGTTTITSNQRTNDLKKPTQLANKKQPEKNIPVRLRPAKNLDERDLNTEEEEEMIITAESTTIQKAPAAEKITQPLVDGKANKEPYTTTPSQHSPRQKPSEHSSTNSSSPTPSSVFKTTKEHVTKLTEKSTLKHNLDSLSPTSKKPETFDSPKTVLEAPKRTTPYTPKTKTTTMDTVAARRSLFENNQASTTSPSRRTPIASPLPGRRPSYMDHTKSSLEHTRRDSLEINKTNYSRKPSQTDEDHITDERNSLVKFNVPQTKLGPEVITTTTTSFTEDINIEEIYDLEILERMLETVTSYEIRRRIRAQIRLIKKNQKNEMISTETTTTTKRTTSAKPTPEELETFTKSKKPSTRDRSLSPTTKSTKKFLLKESESHHQTSTKQEYKRKVHTKEQEEEETGEHLQSPLRPKSSPSTSPQRYHHEDSEYIRDRSPDTKGKPSKTSQRSQSPQENPVCTRNAAHNRPRPHHDDEEDTDELIPHTKRHTTQIEERRQKDILTRPSVFSERSHSPQDKPVCARNAGHNRPRPQYEDEEDTDELIPHTAGHTTRIEERSQKDILTRPSVFTERSHSPQEKPECARNVAHNRPHSPETKEVVREYGSKTTMKKQYFYKDEEHEEVDEIQHETRRQSSGSPTRPVSSRKSPHSSPERNNRNSSPESKKPLLTTQRSRSPQGKTPKSSRLYSRSPETKTSSTLHKTSATYEQSTKSSSPTKAAPTKRTPLVNTPTTKTTKPQEKSTPVWADRKNVLKTPGSTTVTPRKPVTSSTDSRSGFTKTIKSSTTSQRMTSSNKSSFVEDDCITSSYGIGPTDENGLPLFGIRALKKKKQPIVEPCETTEEVTGYVVEEKYYSDNKTKPVVERKELIYSTNPEELEKIKQQVKGTTTRKSLQDVDVKETRQTALISKTNAKATPAIRSSPEDDFLDSTTKYVRRGSVKEMSEKFIHRESSSSITEKSSYPKAGLILRTNSRKNSRDNDTDNENYDSYKTTRVQQHSHVLADSDDAEEHGEHEYEVEESGSRHSGRFINESESECESIKTQREFKKVSSSTSSSTRSFLNTQGEEKVITNVSDCLERMRNADNVIEEGDTAEDQGARALLNKFLGASIIMKGVESSITPDPSSNRQSRIITTTTTNNRSDGSQPAKHEVKTTRITKTIKSGSSSTPVTQTTCDIEEIWDEEILKELLEQARTYEERRKIRSRLRELMADREEKKTSQAGGDQEVKPSSSTETANEDSSASEYEEIIEEVTDYSESEAEAETDKKSETKNAETSKTTVTEVKETTTKVTKPEEKKLSENKPSENSSSDEETVKEEEVPKKEADEKVTKAVVKTETIIEKVEEEVKEVQVESKESANDKTDSSEKGESKKPLMTVLPPQQGSTTTNSQSKQLKSVQNSKATATAGGVKPKTSSETNNSSMHAPYNKTSSSSTAQKSSQNPIVTVQTAGSNRADSQTSISSNKSLNSSNSSKVSNSVVSSNSVVVGNISPRQVDRLGVPQKEDSGTESGEDLRLIAAGLRDQLQTQQQSDSNIIEDVTCALKRLESSLKEGKDIAVDLEKRKALLALVARLQAGLTSPEKLAEIAAAMSELDGNEGLYDETSSPEADHRSNRSRFNKRRSRINRHTVGVSREELADARRYMEDMMLMSNSISQATTPEANNSNNSSPPQWYPLEKNASTGGLLTPPSPSILQRPKEFVAEQASPAKDNTKLAVNNNSNPTSGKRRPLSGDFSVSFDPKVSYSRQEESSKISASSRELNQIAKQSSPPTEDNSKFSRFSSNKKHLMKRANTIDLAKTQKYSSEFDTDSDVEDKGPHLGLKRAVQVSVKKRVANVVPAFEPKTENDRKFLAFINKQSDKPGLGWTTSRSVSNWTNKFGSIKNTFEGGLVGKPPQVPHHSHAAHGHAKPQQSSKLFNQPVPNNSAAPFITTNQQIAHRLKQEAERQAEERRRKLERDHLEYERRERDKQERQRKLEREHLEYERRERDKLERQRQQRERQERERLEREYFESQRREQDQIAAAQHAAILREQEQLAKAQQAANMNVPQPMPINEFKHAPQSVFRPIDNGDAPAKPIYKPIAQLPLNSNQWQSMNSVAPRRGLNSHLSPTSPSHYGSARPDNSFITSPPPSSRSPVGLPWASKPTVDSSSFKTKANRFEERSKYDNINNGNPYLQRHNSLRSSNANNQHSMEEFRKRPSLPNTCDPYSVKQLPPQQQQDPLAYLPPPQNISFTYSDLKPKVTYQSYPCLPTAVVDSAVDPRYYARSREDSLTDPQSVPLVLTSSNPSYCPPQQQQLTQPRAPRQFDIVSPLDSAPTSPSIMLQQTDCTDDDIDSDNMLEYHAVSRVMGKPQSQTAVTVGRRTGHASDDELFGKNSRAARNLLSTMKNIGNPNGDRKQKPPMLKRSEQVTSPKQCLSPDGRSYQAPIVEPLFPELTNFEANRAPLYVGPNKQQQTKPSYAPKYEPPRQNKYKSMENLNRAQTSANYSNYMAPPMQPPLPPAPHPQPTSQPQPHPYVSETQTSYVVTYPTEDTTDDEDFSRHSQHKKLLPPTSLDLRRQRNISETSTGSSTTASMSYSQNLPSPNTSWTANPIMSDDYSQYQNVAATYPATGPQPPQQQQRNQPQASVRGLNQSLAEQSYTYKGQRSPMTSSNNMLSSQSPTAVQQQQPQTEYMRTPPTQLPPPVQQQVRPPIYEAQPPMQTQQPPLQNQRQTQPSPSSPYGAQPQGQLPMAAQPPPSAPYGAQPQGQLPMVSHQPPSSPYGAQPQGQLPMAAPQSQPKSTSTGQKQQKTAKKTTASAYEAQPQKLLQSMTGQQQNQQVVTQKKSTKSTSATQTKTQVTSTASQQQPQAPPRTQKPPITQKPTDYQKSIHQTKQISQTSQSTMTATATSQENIVNNKKSLASMRKSVSVDQPHVREQMIINPQNSNISQEMITKLDQQRERVNNEIRRKSLGNALDYQMEKQARYDTQQQTEIYKSSAPSDTPDIVKSSLPKDENQPILKKFGPPQRHHYMPNAYQSPTAGNMTKSSVTSSSTQSLAIHSKNMDTSANKTTVRISQQHQQQQHQQQQFLAQTRPAVVENPATPQPDDDYIPRNIVFNNVHAFTSMSRRQEDETSSSTQYNQEQAQMRPNKLSKSDSWNQIIQLQNQHMPPPSPKFNQSPTNELRRTKSGHTLALPKMYEAAMAKSDIGEKQKTVAAYFSGQKSPTQQEVVVEQQHTTKKSVINRTKTSEKVSAASRKSLGSNLPIAPGGLTRSATMPHIASLNLLDESNVEDAFEQLMMDQKQQKSSSSTTEKTETKEKDGAVVTTTTKVTTRTVSGSAPKPVSPFAKFKQLDSQQSAKSPTTPTAPGGANTASPSSGGNQPIFKFTDPALNARAATVKDQLLQWCQMKTQEYENIEITNFSTSWNNGLAFCALIHHFLPDAFDYSQLTPKNRRKNFELAFTVADEKAGIAPLLDVEDMVVMQRPDWKCVFVYVQSIYRRFRNCQ